MSPTDCLSPCPDRSVPAHVVTLSPNLAPDQAICCAPDSAGLLRTALTDPSSGTMVFLFDSRGTHGIILSPGCTHVAALRTFRSDTGHFPVMEIAPSETTSEMPMFLPWIFADLVGGGHWLFLPITESLLLGKNSFGVLLD